MFYIENLDSLITGKKDDLIVILNIERQNVVYKCYLKEDVKNQKARDLINNGKLKVVDKITKNIANIISLENPTVNFNPAFKGFKWYNIQTSEMFECVKNDNNDNIWVGNKGTTIMNVPPFEKVDVFGDGSGIALFKFNRNVLDVSGKYRGTIVGGIRYVEGKENLAVYSDWGQIQIKNLPFNVNTEELNISMWFKWNGRDYTMPFGFKECDIYICRNGKLGFNTANSDNFGFNFLKYKNQWVHLSVNFRKGEYGDIYLNGEKQNLAQNCGTINRYSMVFNDTLYLFGWGRNAGYRQSGTIDDVRIFTRNLNDDEVKILYLIQGE